MTDRDVNLLSSDVRRARRPARPLRVIRHRGTISAGVLTLDRGGWIRTITAEGEQLSDCFDPRWLCRLELGDAAVCAQDAALCLLRVVRIHDDWRPTFDVSGALFSGPCFVLPCTGLRK